MKKTIKTLEVLEIFLNTNPNNSFAYFNISDAKALAAQDSDFTVPTIVFFFNGKELLGKFGDINLKELKKGPQKQGRYYLIKGESIMKKHQIIIILIIVFTSVSCDVENLINDLQDGKITAKEKLEDVMTKAKSDFSQDALLASIYGREVSTSGEIDLLNTNSFNAFVYVVQSNSLQSNEFYVPVFGSGPIKSPINFEMMLSFIKDSSAKNIMETVFGTLVGVAIDPTANYSDSPEVLNLLFPGGDVKTFRIINPNSKIDMFLVPGKSIDSTSIINSADWIVNFYSQTSSLVLWLNYESGEVKNLSDL